LAPQQEAGLIGKVGFASWRVPLWAVKMLVDIGSSDRSSNVFLEAYDDPFDFQQSKIRFLPARGSLSVANPFRRASWSNAGAQAGGLRACGSSSPASIPRAALGERRAAAISIRAGSPPLNDANVDFSKASKSASVRAAVCSIVRCAGSLRSSNDPKT